MKVDRIKAVKIGIFDPYLDTLSGGEKYILTIASCLADKNQVFLFWDDDLIFKKANERFGINVQNLNLTKNIFSPRSSFLKKILSTKNYDAIFYVSDGSIPALLSKKNILIFQFPVNWVNGKNILTRLKLNKIQNVLCYSNFVKKFIDKTFNIDSVVLAPSVNSVKIDKKKANLILTVGRFTKAINTKKQEVLIDTFKKMCDRGLSKWSFVIVGSVLSKDKEYVEELKNRSENYPIEILENTSLENLIDYYNKSKIYWHAAGFGEDLQKHPERAEHFGISTVEAMGAGAVPVVINAGGQKEIINDGESGFLWNSLDDLIEKTQLLINNEKLWLQMSDKAIRKARDFAGDRFCGQLYKILDL